jgi:hypothetical protein
VSQSTRIFGAHLSTTSIGGTSYVGVCEAGELTWEYGLQQAVALLDADEYPIGIRGKWSYTGTFFISTAATSGEGGPGGTLWTKALAKAQVALSLKDNAVAGGGNTLSGSGIISNLVQTINDAPQTIKITITGQGAIASTIA